jgi:hypothetical protein
MENNYVKIEGILSVSNEKIIFGKGTPVRLEAANK